MGERPLVGTKGGDPGERCESADEPQAACTLGANSRAETNEEWTCEDCGTRVDKSCGLWLTKSGAWCCDGCGAKEEERRLERSEAADGRGARQDGNASVEQQNSEHGKGSVRNAWSCGGTNGETATELGMTGSDGSGVVAAIGSCKPPGAPNVGPPWRTTTTGRG